MRLRRKKFCQRVIGIVVLCATAACKEDDPLAPTDYAGQYALAQINGHAPGWYHPLGAVDCEAAFTSGSLIITKNAQFRLTLYYDFRCFGTDPYEGNDLLVVQGTNIESTEELIVLNGIGPDLVGGTSRERWSIDVRPMGEHLDVRFYGLNGQIWGDPVLMMGPREPYDAPCLFGCYLP